VELSTTAIFSVFAGYFFGNLKDEASVITERYAAVVQYFNLISSRSITVLAYRLSQLYKH